MGGVEEGREVNTQGLLEGGGGSWMAPLLSVVLLVNSGPLRTCRYTY